MAFPKKTYSLLTYVFYAVAHLLLLQFFFKKIDDIINPSRERVFKFNLTAEDNSTSPFTGKKMINALKRQHKQFIEFYLTGDTLENKKKIDIIRLEALKLKYTNDTMHIIEVHFCDENTYGDFIQLINIMHIDNHSRYMLYDDNFYILDEPTIIETEGKCNLKCVKFT